MCVWLFHLFIFFFLVNIGIKKVNWIYDIYSFHTKRCIIHSVLVGHLFKNSYIILLIVHFTKLRKYSDWIFPTLSLQFSLFKNLQKFVKFSRSFLRSILVKLSSYIWFLNVCIKENDQSIWDLWSSSISSHMLVYINHVAF